MSEHIKCRHGAYLDMQRCCYCDQERIEELEAENKALREALEVLAKLGNGDHYGNSDGNRIAQKALLETDDD